MRRSIVVFAAIFTLAAPQLAHAAAARDGRDRREDQIERVVQKLTIQVAGQAQCLPEDQVLDILLSASEAAPLDVVVAAYAQLSHRVWPCPAVSAALADATAAATSTAAAQKPSTPGGSGSNGAPPSGLVVGPNGPPGGAGGSSYPK